MKSKRLDPLRAGTFAVALLVVTPFTSRADVEDAITRTFEVDPGGQLVVELDRGSIEVKSADAASVEVDITRKAGGSQAKAEKTLKDHEVTVAQTGNKVEIKAEYKGQKAKGWFSRSPELQVKCRITVPRRFDVDLKTAGGGIEVAELGGKVQAHTSGGNMIFGKIEGPVSAHTSGGSITVRTAKGKVDVNTSGGNLSLADIEGDLTAQTSGGSIHVEKLTGQSVVKTSGGHIEVADLKGKIDARTSGGSIAAKFLEQPAGDCTFKTSGGNVTIILSEKIAVDVDAHTSAGRVSTDFPVTAVIQGEQKKNQIRGKINGGGPLITAHTSGGSVRLQKQ